MDTLFSFINIICNAKNMERYSELMNLCKFKCVCHFPPECGYSLEEEDILRYLNQISF